MPIYEYECTNCGHRLEAIHKFSEPLLKDCPECNTPFLRKVVTTANLQFKGTGFYNTDYKRKKGG